MIKILRLFKASYRKDYLILKSYRFSLIGEFFLATISIIFIIFFSRLVSVEENIFLERYDNNYFLFLLSGTASILFLSQTYTSIPLAISQALSLGYFEKNSVHFNWKSFVLNAPHLQILKGKKFIIHCLEINKIEYSLNKFFDLIPKKKLYKYQMKQLTSKIVFQSKEKYAQKLKKIIYK